MPIDLSHLDGWYDDNGHIALSEGMPTFSTDAHSLMLFSEPTHPILLYKAFIQIGGAYPSYPAQTIGDCVSHGHAHCNDLLESVEICLGADIIPCATCTEYIYSASRKVANILSNQDGSYGAAAIKAMTQGGYIPRFVLGGQATYDGHRAKEWGRSGPPSELEQLASKWRLGNAIKIDTREAAISCLSSGNPFTICSNQGFSMQRDSNGFCRPEGTWNHCMHVLGWRPNPKGFCIGQSWGDQSPEGPTDLEQPLWTFWCDEHTMVRILSQGDSWGLYKAAEFKKRSLPNSFRRAA